MKGAKKHTQPNDKSFTVDREYEPTDDAEERLLRVYEFLLEEVANTGDED